MGQTDTNTTGGLSCTSFERLTCKLILLWQKTPAWSPSKQLLTPHPVKGQSRTVNSFPVQASSPIDVCPEGPTNTFGSTMSPQSSSRHNTVASARSQPEWHTAPHWLYSLYRICTLPSHSLEPPTSFTSVERVLHVNTCNNNKQNTVCVMSVQFRKKNCALNLFFYYKSIIPALSILSSLT